MVWEILLSKVCVRKLRQDIWRNKTFVRSCSLVPYFLSIQIFVQPVILPYQSFCNLNTEKNFDNQTYT